MIILAIDPGYLESGLLWFQEGRVITSGIFTNSGVLVELVSSVYDVAVIEQIEGFGMPVGKEVLETVHWAGRFFQVASEAHTTDRLTRKAVKVHLCGSVRAQDGNIRQALKDRFGGSQAVGKKATPGPLFGVKGHAWSALAIAVTYADRQNGQAGFAESYAGFAERS